MRVFSSQTVGMYTGGTDGVHAIKFMMGLLRAFPFEILRGGADWRQKIKMCGGGVREKNKMWGGGVWRKNMTGG